MTTAQDDTDVTLARLLTAMREMRDGNFRRRLVVPAADGHRNGVGAELAEVFNEIAERNQWLVGELVRVRQSVGQEGRLGERLAPSTGTVGWEMAADAVNGLIDDLTRPTAELSRVLAAVAEGDLSQEIVVDARGDVATLVESFNSMTDTLRTFAGEVTRVAREVGTDGRLGGQAQVPGVGGTWRDLTDSVNFMADNLTKQVRSIAQVTTAVAQGDLTQKITVTAAGEMLELKETVNTMVDQLSSFADEVTRVAREVGTDGRLGGQAQVTGVAGTWRDLTDNVNSMANNLTSQVRNIAQVATAVAQGDLTQKITVDARGEILQLKSTINTMVDQLSSFADEVTRVAREVGTDGRLGGQAQVPGVGGTWRDLTDSVNFMANNLTAQVRSIAQVTTAVARGDLSQKITVDARGEILELKSTINTMVDQLSSFADEVTRVAREVGTDGRLGGQARVPGVAGTWKGLTDNVNVMADNLSTQVRSIADVATAVARGDLSQKITVEAKGEVAALADTLNGMVDTLRAFADEVTRVAREVGTEGILGGQARVPNVAGTWKDLTDNVNSMANNLTNQVRNIAQVTTAVALGDLSKKIDVDARGEILELKTTINTMVNQLSSFADEVTRVAREVGTEGKLGGQAEVEGVSGTWKRLTENVNELAGNLTRQVRAIAVVATAVTAGDLTRQITVDASGEVADLKDNINRMIGNLKASTRANQEQDWLKTNLARLSGQMQGHRDLKAMASLVMSELTPLVSAQHGAFFLVDGESEVLELTAAYGWSPRGGRPARFARGESLVGQVAVEKKTVLVTDVPPGYLEVRSGLGSAPPSNLVILPIVFQGETLGVIELGSFGEFTEVHLDLLDQLKESIGVNLNTMLANARTDSLLAESQRLTEELRAGSVELEARARQLSSASKYKSEFMANMSHELRTPLNSLLILAKLLADNLDGNLNPKQVEFARTIHSSGTDLLQLIDDILDLTKVEAGHMQVQTDPMRVSDIVSYVEALTSPLAAEKGLDFEVVVDPDVPTTLHTDEHRLQQILRNLLSNAVKFTHTGEIKLRIRLFEGSVAFDVQDTGIGIPAEKLSVIFEAFQQADGTTSRKYGGTGLGLSISRELSILLDGRLDVRSEPGVGSTFTLYLPLGEQGAVPPVVVEPEALPELLSPVEPTPESLVAPAELPPPPMRFHGEKVLIVDDDLRNVFALTSVLELHGLQVIYADNGITGVRALEQYDDVTLVLMDIMMPELDGNATMAAIRAMSRYADLPVIAVTAKAMKGDREKSLASGATDYVTKPVDTEHLLRLIAFYLGVEQD